VWFKDQVRAGHITFDYDTYLLTAAKAKALKQGHSQTPAPLRSSDDTDAAPARQSHPPPTR